jgi:hypothetical protein
VLTAAFTSEGRRIRTVGVDGTVRQLRCEECGGVHELVVLARARLRPQAQSRD